MENYLATRLGRAAVERNAVERIARPGQQQSGRPGQRHSVRLADGALIPAAEAFRDTPGPGT